MKKVEIEIEVQKRYPDDFSKDSRKGKIRAGRINIKNKKGKILERGYFTSMSDFIEVLISMGRKYRFKVPSQFRKEVIDCARIFLEEKKYFLEMKGQKYLVDNETFPRNIPVTELKSFLERRKLPFSEKEILGMIKENRTFEGSVEKKGFNYTYYFRRSLFGEDLINIEIRKMESEKKVKEMVKKKLKEYTEILSRITETREKELAVP